MRVKALNLNHRFSLLSDPISFAQPKEIGKRKSRPLPWPAATLALLNQSGGCGTRLLKSFRLRQSSPKTPNMPALLGMAAAMKKSQFITVILSQAKNLDFAGWVSCVSPPCFWWIGVQITSFCTPYVHD